MVERIESARSAGYRTHSVKIGGDNADVDIARIEAIENCRQADEAITFDINRAWTPAQAIRIDSMRSEPSSFAALATLTSGKSQVFRSATFSK